MDEHQSGSAPTTAELANKILALGREKQLGIVAAILGLIGFFAPLASAQTGGFFGPSGEVSYSLSQAGLTGVVVLLLALALGAAPFLLPASRRNDVIYYGASAAGLGTLLSVWFVSLSLPMVISAIGHLSLAFYALLVSFGISAYLSASRCYRIETR